MIPCINEYCESIMTDLYVGEKWICVCPVCGCENEHVRIGKTPTEADRLAGAAYAKAKNLEYDEAEKWFLESYRSSSDEYLKCGYIWWAVKCCFGVEYVEEILYPNDSERREYQYVPIIARIPFNYNADVNCDTLREFDKYLRHHSYPKLQALYEKMRVLHTETAAALGNERWKKDVFIAWHGEECKDFARGCTRIYLVRISLYSILKSLFMEKG